MRILLLTFSGTGNTKLCGEYIAKYFMSSGHEIVHYVYDARNEFKEDVNEHVHIGVRKI